MAEWRDYMYLYKLQSKLLWRGFWTFSTQTSDNDNTQTWQDLFIRRI